MELNKRQYLRGNVVVVNHQSARLLVWQNFYRVSLDDLVLTDMRPPVPVYALNLAYLRKKYGMTQQELVEIIGLKNKSSISLIENGKYEPSIENLEKLADFFGVTMDQIVKQDLSQEVSK